MTEIPEHLLKRAAERRAALAGGDDAEATPAGDAAPTAASAESADGPAAVATPAKTRAPLPTLEVEPVDVKPDIAVVAAAKNRKRVPYWAASVLVLLPLWALLYLSAVQPPPAAENDPLVIGEEVYAANCQSCHRPDGSGSSAGGAGQQLNKGHAITTFKDPLAMAHWIRFGAANGARPDGSYGDADRPGGPMNVDTLPSPMPGFTSLSPEELAAVVIYVRSEFGGDIYDPEAEQGFTVEDFTAHPGTLAKEVAEVVALGAGGDPNVSGIARGK